MNFKSGKQILYTISPNFQAKFIEHGPICQGNKGYFNKERFYCIIAIYYFISTSFCVFTVPPAFITARYIPEANSLLPIESFD